MPAILWTSDLHLDHTGVVVRDALLQSIRECPGDVFIVAGDTSVARNLVADLEVLADAAARPTYFVLGNHDHYGGGVSPVRDAVLALGERRPHIQWLPPAGVVTLSPETALVGVDGWADGRLGDPLTTRYVLNDDRFIGELATLDSRRARLVVKRALADADAERLRVLIGRAIAFARTIVIATHIPPFPEALPKTGRLSDPDWLPLVVCGATGSVIRTIAAEHPDRDFVVLCGHTHVAMDVHIGANLRCIVNGARYGEPRVRTLELSSRA